MNRIHPDFFTSPSLNGFFSLASVRGSSNFFPLLEFLCHGSQLAVSKFQYFLIGPKSQNISNSVLSFATNDLTFVPRSVTSVNSIWASYPSFLMCRVQLKCDGTRLRTGGEVKGKLANGVGSQYPSHTLGTWCIQHYYRWCAHLGCQ